jgi:CubicO group peptidase (beta-lactamase class C family)
LVYLLMRSRPLVLPLALAGTLAVGPGAASRQVRPGTTAQAHIDAWLKRQAEAGRFSGAVLVASHGKTIYEGAFGLADREARIPNTIDTPFNICSMGKMFTAVTAMLLVDEGRLDLHAPIARYLPDFPRPAASRITLHHLLSHTSGLGNHMARPDFDRDARRLTTIEALYARVREETPQFEPGGRFSYSNSGFIVAGRIIERVTGRPYAEVVRRRLLEPAGMTHTHFYLVDDRPATAARGYVPDGRGGFAREPSVVPNPASDGGVHSTVRDLLAFDRALHGGTLLSDRARRLMMTPNLNGYGYGLSIKPPEEHVSRRTSIGHTGGLADRSAVLRRFIPDEVTLVVLSNLSQAAIDAAREIERLYFEAAPGPVRMPS